MAVVFSSVSDALKQLERDAVKTTNDAIKIVTHQYVNDVMSGPYVPVMTSQLAKSVLQFTDWTKGVVVWRTPYAKKVYEKNISGVEQWDLFVWDKYKNDYADILAEELENKIWR